MATSINIDSIFCFAFIGFSLLATTFSHAEETSYKVTYVYDGDTVKLRPIDSSKPNNDFKLRLTDIDAPEREQNYGLKSRRALIKLCQGEFSPSQGGKRGYPGVQGDNILVTTNIIGTDKYHRPLGSLICNHIDASLYLAEHGLAWHYAQYSSDVEINNAALKARQQRLGLWADDNPIPPWNWRRNHRSPYVHHSP